jgi:DNA-binding GntR family transcriptional regulator
MGVAPEEPLVLMKRVRRVGGLPLHYDTAYFRESAFPGIERSLKETPLLARDVLRVEYGVEELHTRSLSLETEPADAELAGALDVQQGFVLFRVERTVATEPGGSPAVLGVAYFRSDAVRLNMELGEPGGIGSAPRSSARHQFPHRETVGEEDRVAGPAVP